MSDLLPHRFSGPALLDLQVNGYGGFDFNSDPATWAAADFRRVRDGLAGRGVAVVLPTLITAPTDRLVAAARRYREILREDPELEPNFPRLHLEGPFISPEDGPRGAHPRESCALPVEQPDLVWRVMEESGGRVGLVTLAPELPGALELVERLSEAGIVVAIGHTAASAECLDAAVRAGARLSTHLGNGSHQMLPRLDNYVQAQLGDDRLAASFIADGHHVPWYTLKNFLRAKTAARSILVSDSVAAADAPPGRYSIGDAVVEATPSGRVQVPGQPNLAGSSLTLDRAVVNVATHCGFGFEEAWAMASTTPAALLGLTPPREVEVEVSAEGCRVVS
ncbi:MAG TPA: hypothetical protein VF167_00260 [Longimicrobiaceae bacterium]